MESDRVAVMDLFEEFLKECEQVDEPEVNHVLGMIRGRFENVDRWYRNSKAFKSFLRGVMPKIRKSPWETMKTVADDLKYHTFAGSDRPNGPSADENAWFEGNQWSEGSDEETASEYSSETSISTSFSSDGVDDSQASDSGNSFRENYARSCQSKDGNDDDDDTTSEYSGESSISTSFSSDGSVEDNQASDSGDSFQEDDAIRSCQPSDSRDDENLLEYIEISIFNISDGVENSQAHYSGDHEIAGCSEISTSKFPSIMVDSVGSLSIQCGDKIIENSSSSEPTVNSEALQPVESRLEDVDDSGNSRSDASVLSQPPVGGELGQEMIMGLNFSPFMYVRHHYICTESINEAAETDYENGRYYRNYDLDTFEVENMLSEVDTGFCRSSYDEVECNKLEELARVRKFKKIEELKSNISKLNVDISRFGSREIPDWSEKKVSLGLQTLGKVRSLMGKYLAVHKKICELTNTETHQDRQAIKFTGTKTAAINRAIESFYNEYDSIDMPCFDEISDVIRRTNDEERSESQITAKAVAVLRGLGRIRRRQRANEFDNLILSYLPMEGSRDPASADLSLWRKLCKNEELNQERMDSVINDYANREDIRTHRRSKTRRRSLRSDSLVQLDLGDFIRSLLSPSSEADEVVNT